jgi:hypothetical protein
MINSPTTQGARKLVSLGILTVFDLRSDPEMRKYSSPIPVIEDVEVVPTPVFKNEDYSPEKLAKCVRAATVPLHSSLTILKEV